MRREMELNLRDAVCGEGVVGDSEAASRLKPALRQRLANAPVSARSQGKGLQSGIVSSTMSDMKMQKTITGRQLRRGTPEENLTPGESVIVRKKGGKIFELRRLDDSERSLTEHLDCLLKETPNPGERVRTNLAQVIMEDRE